MPTFGNNPGDDPLGNAVQARARAAQQTFNNPGGPGWGNMSGVLPDPAWQGLFQAMSEQGADKVAQGAPFGAQTSLSPATGMRSPMAPQQALPGYGAPDQAGIFGVAQQQGRSALNGLNSAFRPNNGAVSGPNYNG